MKDHYEKLGISRDSSEDEIKSAYRKKAKECHPDRGNPEGSEAFRDVHEAYSILADPDSRKAYDRRLRQVEAAPVRVRLRSRPRSRQRGRRAEPLRPPVRDAGPSRDDRPIRGPADPFSLLERFLGAHSILPDVSPGAERRGGTGEFVRVVLSPAQARRGGRVRIRVPVRAVCLSCRGTGTNGGWRCRRCGGRGAVPEEIELLLRYPAGVPSPYTVTIPLERYGLAGTELTVRFEQ